LILKVSCLEEEVLIHIDTSNETAKKYLKSGDSIEGWVIDCNKDVCAFRYSKDCLIERFYDGRCFIVVEGG